jgi:carbon monoxide dehydrogenase subunit G
MKIANEFTVSVPLERAWEVLTDLEGIAPCLPGAQLTGRDGDVYQGKVKIKVGPVTSEYAGTATFTEKDDVAHRAVIDAKGRDSRGAGNASAQITAQLHPQGEQTTVSVDTDLKITGKIAQFGSGMIAEVSEKLLGQFAACLEAKLSEPAAAAAATPAAEAPPAPTEPQLAPTDATTSETVAAATGTGAAATEPEVARTFTPSPEPEALDLLGVSRGAVAKRLLPVAAGALVVVAVIIYVATR